MSCRRGCSNRTPSSTAPLKQEHHRGEIEQEIENAQKAVAQSKALKEWIARYPRGPPPLPPAPHPAAAAAQSAAPASSSSQVAVRPPVPTGATMGATRQWARRGKHNNGHDDTTMGNDYFSLMQDSVTETPASNSNVVLKSRSSRSKSRSPIVRRRVDYKFMSLRNKPHRPVRPVRPQNKRPNSSPYDLRRKIE